jgi:hypothetical protein
MANGAENIRQLKDLAAEREAQSDDESLLSARSLVSSSCFAHLHIQFCQLACLIMG